MEDVLLKDEKETSDAFVNAQIDALELDMIDNMQLIDVPLKHTFVPKMYIREMLVPKDTLMVGKVHLTIDPYALMEGSKLMFTADGGQVTLHAGHTGITEKGTRRVGFALEDCRWINYHVLTDHEEELRKEGLDEEALIELIEERIYEKLEPLPDRNGKTVYELYQEKLKGALACQD